LLAAQDPAASIRLFMKMAGGGDLSQIDTAAFLEQAAEYESGGDLRDSIHKIGMTAWSTHPVPVARASELRKWIDSGEYGRILAGDYPRRDSDGNASVSDDVKAAASSYRETFKTSQDPLVGLLRKLGDGAADLAGSAARGARSWASDAGRRPRRDDEPGTPPES
jgi:hypothetical protein